MEVFAVFLGLLAIIVGIGLYMTRKDGAPRTGTGRGPGHPPDTRDEDHPRPER